jgi:TolA-binding protein
MRFLVAAGLFVLCAVAVPLSPAHAQVESREGIALQNMILELRAEVQSLRDQMARGAPQGGGSNLGSAQPPTAGAPVNDMTAQLLDRVQRLEDDVRQLRGRVDEADVARQRQGDELAKQIGDLNFKLQNGGAAAPAAAGASAAGASTLSPPPANLATPAKPGDALPVPPPPPARRTPEMMLQEGNAALARRDYAAAEARANEVLTTGKGPRANDAHYLQAQSLAGRKDNTGAAIAYEDTYNANRTGVHAQESLLGQANALAAIGEKPAACGVLNKLRAEFATPRADLKEPIAAARRNAACK